MVAIDDPYRCSDLLQVVICPVRLGPPHLGDLGEESLVLTGSRRHRLVFFSDASDVAVEYRAVADVGDSARVRIGGKGEHFRQALRVPLRDIEAKDMQAQTAFVDSLFQMAA